MNYLLAGRPWGCIASYKVECRKYLVRTTTQNCKKKFTIGVLSLFDLWVPNLWFNGLSVAGRESNAQWTMNNFTSGQHGLEFRWEVSWVLWGHCQLTCRRLVFPTQYNWQGPLPSLYTINMIFVSITDTLLSAALNTIQKLNLILPLHRESTSRSHLPSERQVRKETLSRTG